MEAESASSEDPGRSSVAAGADVWAEMDNSRACFAKEACLMIACRPAHSPSCFLVDVASWALNVEEQ